MKNEAKRYRYTWAKTCKSIGVLKEKQFKQNTEHNHLQELTRIEAEEILSNVEGRATTSKEETRSVVQKSCEGTLKSDVAVALLKSSAAR